MEREVAREGWSGGLERVRGVVDMVERVTRIRGRVHVWGEEAEELLARDQRRLISLRLRCERLCRQGMDLLRRQRRIYPNLRKNGWLRYSQRKSHFVWRYCFD